MIHAPAPVAVVVERDLDHLGADALVAPRLLQRTVQVVPVQAQHYVSGAQRGGRVRGQEDARHGRVQRMVGGERRAGAQVREDLRIQLLGQLDALAPAFAGPGDPSHQDDRAGRGGEQSCRSGQLVAARHGGRGNLVTADVRQRRDRIDARLLQRDIEAHVGGTGGRGQRDLLGPQQRLVRRGDGSRLRVPLAEVAHQRALVLRGVHPVDPGAPLGRIDRARRAQDQHGHAVHPGVEDRHGRVHQAHVAVNDRRQRLSGNLRVAMGDRDGMLLMEHDEHLGIDVAEVVDQAVVQTSEARTGVQEDIGDVERADHLRDRVACPQAASASARCGDVAAQWNDLL